MMQVSAPQAAKYLIRLPKTVKLIPKDFVGKDTGDFFNEKENIRVLKYTIRNKEYFLETNLFDTELFTLNILKEYYHERWESRKRRRILRRRHRSI